MEVTGEEERELSEVAEEGFEFEEERHGGDGIVGSWERVGRDSILVGSGALRERCEDFLGLNA